LKVEEVDQMWHLLRKFEEKLFFPLYLIYASLTGLPRSIRCQKCGRWLFTYYESYLGLCGNCKKEEALSHPIRTYESSYQRRIERFGVPPAVHSFQKPVAKKVGEGRILDVGCGMGALLARLESRKRELYGFDISPTGVRIAKSINKEANFFVADARNMPFKSNTFDYITCIEVLEHIEGDDTVKECYRVLKPNGSALFTVPNKSGPGGIPVWTHVHYFTFKSFACYLEQANFEIVSGDKFGLHIPIFSHLFHLMQMVFKRKLPLAGPLNIKVPEFLATHFLIECRKPPT
jgi:2-polyprenyl-3-methyl-5-hydroxy-6-metoxy-1,4-benzoquinol methylase